MQTIVVALTCPASTSQKFIAIGTSWSWGRACLRIKALTANWVHADMSWRCQHGTLDLARHLLALKMERHTSFELPRGSVQRAKIESRRNNSPRRLDSPSGDEMILHGLQYLATL